MTDFNPILAGKSLTMIVILKVLERFARLEKKKNDWMKLKMHA